MIRRIVKNKAFCDNSSYEKVHPRDFGECSPWESEVDAFRHLGIKPCHWVLNEQQLFKRFPGRKIPEGLFKINGQYVTVEVKRLPSIKITPRRDGWKWAPMIRSAVSKVDGLLPHFNIRSHKVVVVVQTQKQIDKVQLHASRTIAQMSLDGELKVPVELL